MKGFLCVLLNIAVSRFIVIKVATTLQFWYEEYNFLLMPFNKYICYLHYLYIKN